MSSMVAFLIFVTVAAVTILSLLILLFGEHPL